MAQKKKSISDIRLVPTALKNTLSNSGDFIDIGKGIESVNENVQEAVIDATTPPKQTILGGLDLLGSDIQQKITESQQNNPFSPSVLSQISTDPTVPNVQTNGITSDAYMRRYSPEEQLRLQQNGALGVTIDEPLNPNDYFPAINKPIQVGTYSGRVIGSNPIFASQGGYVPFTVIDARERTIARQAQAKKAKLDATLQANLDTADQFDVQLGTDFQNEMIRQVNETIAQTGSADAMTDYTTKQGQEWLRTKNYYEQLAKEITGTQVLFAQMEKERAEGRVYDPEVEKLLQQFRIGSKEYLTDPKKLQEFRAKATTYEDIGKARDIFLKDLQYDEISLDPSKLRNEDGSLNVNAINDARNAFVKKSNMSNDEYYSASAKYVDMDRIDEYVDGYFTQKRGNVIDTPEMRDSLKKSIISGLATKIEDKVQIVGNERQRAYEFQKNWARQEKKDVQFYDKLNKYGKQDLLPAIESIRKNPNYSRQQKEDAVANVYKTRGWIVDKSTGVVSAKLPKSTSTDVKIGATKNSSYIPGIKTKAGKTISVKAGDLFADMQRPVSERKYLPNKTQASTASLFDKNPTNIFPLDYEEFNYKSINNNGQLVDVIDTRDGNIIQTINQHLSVSDIPLVEMDENGVWRESKETEEYVDSKGKKSTRYKTVKSTVYTINGNEQESQQSALGETRVEATRQLGKIN